MHRDKKVGLALGILLVGIVAALFFRNDPGEPELPQLADPAPLDELIDDREGPKPYPVDSPSLGTTDSAVSLDVELGNPWDDAPTETTALPFGPDGSIGDGLPAAGPPDPIRPSREASGERQSDPNAAWEPIPEATVQPARAGETRWYRVQRGDTLSDIAARTLGDANAFRRLYEANRDILKSPNRLPVGTRIRIPQTGEPGAGETLREAELPWRDTVSAPASSTTAFPADADEIRQPAEFAPLDVFDQDSDSDPAEPDTDDATAPTEPVERKFIPVRRSPFVPGRAANDETSRHGGTRLTQLPPDQLPLDSDTSTATGRTYTVRPGDSLERIAIRHYGTRRAVQQILKANGLPDANRLRSGQRLLLP